MVHSEKYLRSLHAHISLGTTSDDRFMPNGYVKEFAKLDNLVLTEKLDGQNNCFSQYGVFARSHSASTVHPWDKPLRERWNLIKNDLGELELFGENMFGVHSIAYSKLESYFYLFAVRCKGQWFSWDEVKYYAELFDFPVVPEIEIATPLQQFVTKSRDENVALQQWFKSSLSMTWEDAVETEGLLGGYDPHTKKPCCEGYVVRNRDAFTQGSSSLNVCENEFDHLFKVVRKSHVKTDVHWSKTWTAAQLCNYEKYQWSGYSYLGEV